MFTPLPRPRRSRVSIGAKRHGAHRLVCVRREAGRRRALPNCAAYAAVAFFQDNEYAAHSTRTSNFNFSTRAAAASFAVPGRICVDRCFCGRATAREPREPRRRAEIGCGHAADLLGLGALDAHEGCIAQLVAPRLDGEQGGQGKLDGLKPSAFEFAFDLSPASVFST